VDGGGLPDDSKLLASFETRAVVVRLIFLDPIDTFLIKGFEHFFRSPRPRMAALIFARRHSSGGPRSRPTFEVTYAEVLPPLAPATSESLPACSSVLVFAAPRLSGDDERAPSA